MPEAVSSTTVRYARMWHGSRWRYSLWLIVPPLSFLLKDLVATMVVLSTEPGITARAVFFYSVALLPGSLFASNGMAPIDNVAVGLCLALVLFGRRCIKKPPDI
jgi:hypothetical protein